MTYRISLTGAQGTGKSTLARAIVARLRADGVADVETLTGVGDTVARAGGMTGARADADVVRHFARLHQVREAEATGSVVVFDRCLLDTLAYAQVLGCFSSDEFEALRVDTITSSRRFAQLLWLRVTHDYPVESEADESPELRRAIDAAIGQLARDNGLTLIEQAIPPQPMDAIVDAVLACWRADRGV